MPTLIKLLIAIIVIVNYGLSQTMDPRLEKAQALEVSKDFEKALKLYEKISRDEPDNYALTFKIASLAYSLKDYKKAATFYEKLAPNGNPSVLYNLACSFSLAGKEKKALQYLGEAVEQGFNQLSLMKTDPDLAAIRELNAFTEIMHRVKSIENYPEARAFDFWVGEWNVFNPQGNQVGESSIEKILADHVILENWYGGQGFEGKSFNHYHIDSGKWIQYWVDQASGRIHFEGNYDPDQHAMVYHEVNTAERGKSARRLRFFNVSQDSVRQLSERSTDSGKTWSVEYDFMYIRK